MKKFIIALIISILFFQQNSFCSESKGEMYYKSQIQNQRYYYNYLGFYKAVKRKNHVAIEAFLDAGFNPNSKWMGKPLVFYTIQKHDNRAFNMFLSHSVDLDIQTNNSNLLFYGIHNGNSFAVKTLIKNKVDVNKIFNEKTPLNYAISSKQTKIAEMLLKAGAKPDEETYKLVKNSKDEYLKSLFE